MEPTSTPTNNEETLVNNINILKISDNNVISNNNAMINDETKIVHTQKIAEWIVAISLNENLSSTTNNNEKDICSCMFSGKKPVVTPWFYYNLFD